MNTSAQSRADAAKLLKHILDKKRTIDWVEHRYPAEIAEPITRELVYGVLRYLPGLQSLILPLLKKPLRNKDQDVSCLLLVGAYQLKFMTVPAHAIINETVSAADVFRKPWAKGLVNAILRRISKTEQSFEAESQFPTWLRQALSRQYPETSSTLMAALLDRAPMCLRINTLRCVPADYRAALSEANLTYTDGPFPETVILNESCATARLPGFAAGWVSVQDCSAQWASHLLLSTNDLQQSDCRILDACAAPGGKLFHLYERSLGTVTPLALELEPRRAEATASQAERLGHELSIINADARTRDWWDGHPFSHILLDAPCSGSGTIRRHPDIKVLLTESSITEQRRNQLELLNNLWPTLRPGGTLLYCTCSLLEQENDKVIETFVTQLKDAGTPPGVDPIELPTGQATRFGWQLLPTDPMTDGFFFSRLTKPDRT